MQNAPETKLTYHVELCSLLANALHYSTAARMIDRECKQLSPMRNEKGIDSDNNKSGTTIRVCSPSLSITVDEEFIEFHGRVRFHMYMSKETG